jgi:hypothetical protein
VAPKHLLADALRKFIRQKVTNRPKSGVTDRLLHNVS